MNVVHVLINEEGDGVAALYVDGEQVVAGDAYHNAIGPRIEGILHGLSIMGWDRRYTEYRMKGGTARSDDFCLMGEDLPEYLDEFDLDSMKKKRKNWGD